MTPSDAPNYQPVKVVQDESSHWYVIPNHLFERFFSLLKITQVAQILEHIEQAEKEFEELFSKYRTGGDINNIQLFAQL